MIVCHCKAKTDGEIRAAILSGSRNRQDVGRACGAGSVCGGCVPTIVQLLRSQRSTKLGSSSRCNAQG